MKKRLVSTITALVMLAFTAINQGFSGEAEQTENSAFTITSHAADIVIYNGDTMSTFSDRTAESVAKKYTDAYYAGSTYDDRNSSSYYSTPASTENPYYQGVLSNDTLKCMQEMTNFYRWLVGNKPLKVKCTQNESLQYQALDRCFKHSHWISESDKPDDMPLDLWKKGEQCDHNILAWYTSPRYSITQWMNEGYYLSSGQWGTLGHRYGIINPNHTDIQYGFCGDVALGDYDDFNSGEYPNEAFYAFPSPGYVPADCISPTYSAWSVAFDTRKIKVTDTSAVKVTVTNLSTKTSYECTSSNDKASVSSSSIAFVQPSEYDKSTYNYTDSFKVVITGLTDTATSKAAQVQYTVRFFELKDYAVGSISKAGFDYSTILFYKDSYSTTDSLKKLGAVLPTTVTLTNDFGAAAKVKTKGKWTLDEKNKCWYNSVDPSVVPSRFIDRKGLLSRIEIKYQSTDDSYDYYNTLYVSPSKAACGDSVKFSIHRTLVTYNTSSLFQIVKDSSGSYYCRKSYNSLSSPEFDTSSSNAYHDYNIKATNADSGEYISLYYTTSSSWDTAYACNTARTLTVEHNYTPSVTKQPTCTDKGTRTYTCSGCGAKYTEEIAAAGHKWDTVKYTWTQTSSGYTCTAARVCKNDSSHKETETVTASYAVTTKPTCTAKGKGTYTATFKNTAFAKQTKSIDIAAAGHRFGSWTNSGFDVSKGARLQTRVCSVCKAKETRSVSGAVVRCAGAGRFETATEISKAEFTTAKTVILANGMNYADALAGVPLAKKLDAPILLTNTKALDTATADEIKRLKAEKVIILGGKGAISADVEQALQKMGLTTERIAGKTRFGTATAIAEKLNSEPTEIIFVYGLNYADALSVSPIAALKNAPIIYLTQDGELNADTAAYLETIKGKVKTAYVIGGEGVISNDMMNKAASVVGLKTAARIWGANRYSTCIEVNKKFASTLTGKVMCVATGLNFPDALAGGVLAAKKAAPLFLTANSLSDEQTAYLKAKELNCIYVFGGTGAVSADIVDKIAIAAAAN